MNDTITNNEQPQSILPSQVKKFKLPKPTFEEFLAQVVDLVRAVDIKNRNGHLIKILLRGYSEPLNSDNIEKTYSCLFEMGESLSVFALFLFQQVIQGKKGLIQELFAKIKEEYAVMVGFPYIPTTKVKTIPPLELEKALDDWIIDNTFNKNPSLDWYRKAIISLIRDKMTVQEFGALHSIIKSVVPKKKMGTKKDSSNVNHYRGYLTQLIKIFNQQKPKISKLTSLLSFSGIFEINYSLLQSDFKDLDKRVDELRHNNKVLQEDLVKLSQKESDLTQNIQVKEEIILQRDKMLSDEKIKYLNLEDHNKRELQQALALRSHKISVQFLHELNTAKSALESSAPNIKIALDRINRLIKNVEEMGEKNG